MEIPDKYQKQMTVDPKEKVQLVHHRAECSLVAGRQQQALTVRDFRDQDQYRGPFMASSLKLTMSSLHFLLLTQANHKRDEK